MSAKRYKSASKSQLKEAYNTSYNTLKIWLEPFQDQIGAYRGQAYTPKQVKTIIDCLGEPERLELISAK